MNFSIFSHQRTSLPENILLIRLCTLFATTVTRRTGVSMAALHKPLEFYISIELEAPIYSPNTENHYRNRGRGIDEQVAKHPLAVDGTAVLSHVTPFFIRYVLRFRTDSLSYPMSQSSQMCGSGEVRYRIYDQ